MPFILKEMEDSNQGFFFKVNFLSPFRGKYIPSVMREIFIIYVAPSCLRRNASCRQAFIEGGVRPE